VRDSMQYALDKAIRRGLRAIPLEVAACIAEQDRLLAETGSGAGDTRESQGYSRSLE
jgi:hypothetical protein